MAAPPSRCSFADVVMQQHIAVVDDESAITELLGHYLGGHGFRVTPLVSGRALMELMPVDPPELVLLDLGLPGEDGFAIARQLRERWRCGLVISTGRGDAVDKIVGLEVGADDYVTKPFDLRELVARIKAVLRRIAPPPRLRRRPRRCLPLRRRPAWISSAGSSTSAPIA